MPWAPFHSIPTEHHVTLFHSLYHHLHSHCNTPSHHTITLPLHPPSHYHPPTTSTITLSPSHYIHHHTITLPLHPPSHYHPPTTSTITLSPSHYIHHHTITLPLISQVYNLKLLSAMAIGSKVEVEAQLGTVWVGVWVGGCVLMWL